MKSKRRLRLKVGSKMLSLLPTEKIDENTTPFQDIMASDNFSDRAFGTIDVTLLRDNGGIPRNIENTQSGLQSPRCHSHVIKPSERTLKLRSNGNKKQTRRSDSQYNLSTLQQILGINPALLEDANNIGILTKTTVEMHHKVII